MLLTLPEAAGLLRVSVRTLEREAAAGRLCIVRVRRRRLVEEGELGRYVAACRSGERESGGKSESASAVAALSSGFLRPQPEPTRGRSKLRSCAARSRLKLGGSTTR